MRGMVVCAVLLINLLMFSLPVQANAKQTLECDTCLSFVSEFETWVSENATETEIIYLLEKFCAFFPKYASTCDKLMKDTTGLVNLIKKADPGIVCGEVQMCLYECCLTYGAPEQIHLAMNSDPSVMFVSWATLANSSSIVQYGTSSTQYSMTVTGITTTYRSGGWRGTIHHVELRSLKSATKYYYMVGDGTNWSKQFWFVTQPQLNDPKPINVLVIGDMGTTYSATTIKRLADEVQSGKYDFLLHNGDIAYADGYQPIWDTYFRMIEPVAAYLPYMVSPGNHDVQFDFASYRHRFYMPNTTLTGEQEALYYSMNFRFAHIVSYATDTVLDTNLFAPGTSQYAWLSHDLREYSAKIAKGNGLNWLIVMGHRPLYCTNVGDDYNDCVVNAPMFRSWLEDLIHETRVDLFIQAHEHSYERTYPVYHGVPSMSYNPPKAPIYVVNGAAGNREQLDKTWMNPPPSWSAFHASVYGYAKMQITPTTLNWQFVRDSDGQIIDSFTITKS